MKKVTLFLLAATMITAYGCKKDKTTTDTTVDFATLQTDVLTDFVQKVALPQYANLQTEAAAMNTAILTLKANQTDANLAAARTAWQNTRASWEQCEGFLIGPVEDDNYDPNMDTWPVDFHEMDSLLAQNSNVSIGDLQSVGDRLRGFHPIEYILWGTAGNKVAAEITPAQMNYMVSLSTDIANITTKLHNSWLANGGNFQDEILLAGKGSSLYTTRQEALLAIIGGMSGICDEVGTGKIEEPFVAQDSTISESPFSHNSIIDFKNNIIGAQNVYLGKYTEQGKSMSDLVAAKNTSLDNQIKQEFQTAINTFGNVTTTFEKAITQQPTQIKAIQDELAKLQALLDGQLADYIVTNVKN